MQFVTQLPGGHGFGAIYDGSVLVRSRDMPPSAPSSTLARRLSYGRTTATTDRLTHRRSLIFHKGW